MFLFVMGLDVYFNTWVHIKMVPSCCSGGNYLFECCFIGMSWQAHDMTLTLPVTVYRYFTNMMCFNRQWIPSGL